MGDAAAAAAAAASTSAPATPTSILICREDGSDLFHDADDGGASADLFVARDDRLLVVDRDDEYVSLLLSKESTSAAGCGAALAEEMEEWMKAARSGCVRWIIKVVRALFRPLPRTFSSSGKKFHLYRCSFAFSLLLADDGDVPVEREDRVRRGDLPRSLLGATASRCNELTNLHFPLCRRHCRLLLLLPAFSSV